MTTSKPYAKRLTRVIRDARDATLDYFIPAPRADALYKAGHLIMVEVHGGLFEYATRSRVQVR